MPKVILSLNLFWSLFQNGPKLKMLKQFLWTSEDRNKDFFLPLLILWPIFLSPSQTWSTGLSVRYCIVLHFNDNKKNTYLTSSTSEWSILHISFWRKGESAKNGGAYQSFRKPVTVLIYGWIHLYFYLWSMPMIFQLVKLCDFYTRLTCFPTEASCFLW